MMMEAATVFLGQVFLFAFVGVCVTDLDGSGYTNGFVYVVEKAYLL